MLNPFKSVITQNPVHTVIYAILALCLIGSLFSLFRAKDTTKSTQEQLDKQTIRVTELVQLVDEKDRELTSVKISKDASKVTTIIKKNGDRVVVREDTKTNTDKETQKDTQTNTKTDSTTHESETVHDTKTTTETSSSKLSQYSVAPQWRPLGQGTTELNPYAIPNGLVLGIRLGGLPVWAEAGWDRTLVGSASWSLGLRVEF